MPVATSVLTPGALASTPQRHVSSYPRSKSAIIAKTRWNASSVDLCPVSKRNDLEPTADNNLLEVSKAQTPQDIRAQFRAAIATASALTSGKLGRGRADPQLLRNRKLESIKAPRPSTTKADRQNVVASLPIDRKLLQPRQIEGASDGRQSPANVGTIGTLERVAPTTSLLCVDPKRQQLPTRAEELSTMQSNRRRALHDRAQVRRQDVEARDASPLIELIHRSSFVQLRRDAAAAIASLSCNAANLNLLDEVDTLGAILAMLTSPVDQKDREIVHNCAQALTALVRLSSVKSKLFQAPGGIDCVFILLHTTTDRKVRLAGFEVVARLVTTDEWREAVAKREGFAFMLHCCASNGVPHTTRGGRVDDTRTRILAASVLHQLVTLCDNRLLFYRSGHFTALSGLLRDPFLDKGPIFRRELLKFVHLLLSEKDNAHRFASLGLVPYVLSILDDGSSCPKLSLQVVSILDMIAKDEANHEALVQAGVMPRLVELCFPCSINAFSADQDNKRPHTASATLAQSKATISRLGPASSAYFRSRSASILTTSEATAIVRMTLGVFCAMACNIANRQDVIQSKVLDEIAARELYTSSDKCVRRAVITLLTSLICTKRKQHTEPDEMDETSSDTSSTSSRGSLQSSEHDHQHYIELFARGVVKCLFGILAGDDYGMRVDALGALARLTHDAPSRLTLCKPTLLSALGQYAFHPLASTRLHVAQIIANFAERPENVLKLVDAGLLPVLVGYVSPLDRSQAVSHCNDKDVGEAILVEATRALAAISELHVTRARLVESGVLRTLAQLARSQSTRSEVRSYAQSTVRKLQHDAAALCIQAIYRGWYVRTTFAGCKRGKNFCKLFMLVETAAAFKKRR